MGTAEDDGVGDGDVGSDCEARNIFFFFLINFFWSIGDLECCVSFRCAAKGTGHNIHICTFFFRFFPHIGYHRVMNRFP